MIEAQDFVPLFILIHLHTYSYFHQMNLIYVLTCMFCVVMAFSCAHDNCNGIGKFSGITQRDDSGKLISRDNDDWNLHDHWDEAELALFEKTYKTNCTPPSHFTITAYPNPTTGQFQVLFNKTNATRVDLRLVDSECNVLTARDGIESNSFGMQAKSNKPNGVARLYYKFIEDGCEYEGHGDIRIEKL